MNGKLIRFQQTGDFHFLTTSCHHRQPFFSPVTAMELFEDAMERVRTRYHFVIAGYVVMPEHVHLLVNEIRVKVMGDPSPVSKCERPGAPSTR